MLHGLFAVDGPINEMLCRIIVSSEKVLLKNLFDILKTIVSTNSLATARYQFYLLTYEPGGRTVTRPLSTQKTKDNGNHYFCRKLELKSGSRR